MLHEMAVETDRMYVRDVLSKSLQQRGLVAVEEIALDVVQIQTDIALHGCHSVPTAIG